MKTSIGLILFFLLFLGKTLAQDLTLNGVIDVHNDRLSKPISLIDDFYYEFCPGDKLIFSVSGVANLAPRDEERKGGGFLGLFKKRYVVRIDNLVEAKDASFIFVINQECQKSIKSSDAKSFELDLPYHVSDNLKQVYKLNSYITSPMSPLRAGSYSVQVTVNSEARIQHVADYFLSKKDDPALSFSDIKPFVEAGKLIYRFPDKIVDILNRSLMNNPNISNIRFELYKYLISFAPNNTSVRNELAKEHLSKLNFSEASRKTVETVKIIYSKPEMSSQDKFDLAEAYMILGKVDEQKELGLNENAYTKASYFFDLAAQLFLSVGRTDKYSSAVINQVRSLQKVHNIESLKLAVNVLEKQIQVLRQN